MTTKDMEGGLCNLIPFIIIIIILNGINYGEVNKSKLEP